MVSESPIYRRLLAYRDWTGCGGQSSTSPLRFGLPVSLPLWESLFVLARRVPALRGACCRVFLEPGVFGSEAIGTTLNLAILRRLR